MFFKIPLWGDPVFVWRSSFDKLPKLEARLQRHKLLRVRLE